MNNDLISREALLNEIKNAQEKLKSDNDTIWERNRGYFKGLAWANRIIIDAPTVEPTENSAIQYSLGYQDGFLEGKKLNERPQGEWILMYCSCGDRYYSCSICNRVIEVQNGQSLKDYPFCHCGARMKGGAENETDN